MFSQQQVLESGFKPTENYLPFPKRNKKNKVNILSMDIAVSGGRENDNTIFELGYYNHKLKKSGVEYVASYNGLNSVKQVVLLKRLFYDYDCDYAVIDTKGVGNVFFDFITVSTYDEERNCEYPAWTVCQDELLQISSDKVIQDKINRTISQDAEKVVIPVAGTAEINSNIHLSLRKNLTDHKIEFLKDESEIEVLLSKDKDWLFKTSQERAEILLPYVETRLMVYESIALEQKMTSSGVAVSEVGTATKDRYMCTGYFNYFCDKLGIKYAIEEENEDDNFDDIQLVF